ncbi:MAG: RNA polymerase sigma factor [Acidobacteriota bacterium]
MVHGDRKSDRSTDNLNELLDRGFRYARSLTHDRYGAEDLVQDAAMAMLGRDADWEQPYFFATIRNRFIDRYRRDRRVMFVSLEAETDDGRSERSGVPHQDFEPLDSFEAAHLHQALGALRDDEREALFLAVVEGYTAEEIGRFTRRPRGTVLSMIFRAKRKMRDALEVRVDRASRSASCTA